MAAQNPDTINDGLFFRGDVKRFTIVGNTAATATATLDGSAWSAITGATLYLTSPSGTVTSYAATYSGSLWGYTHTFGASDEVGVWDAYWTITDGSNIETVGSFRFTLRKRRGS